MRRRIACVVALGAVLGGLGCSSAPNDETPSGALRLFLEAMARSDWDRAALRDAYALLSPDAREGLEERAGMAETLSGGSFEAWEMLAQGRFRLRFTPRRREGMVERIDAEGERALVIVTGSRDGEHAEVPMVREGDAWRVDLRLPPVRQSDADG